MPSSSCWRSFLMEHCQHRQVRISYFLWVLNIGDQGGTVISPPNIIKTTYFYWQALSKQADHKHTIMAEVQHMLLQNSNPYRGLLLPFYYLKLLLNIHRFNHSFNLLQHHTWCSWWIPRQVSFLLMSMIIQPQNHYWGVYKIKYKIDLFIQKGSYVLTECMQPHSKG